MAPYQAIRDNEEKNFIQKLNLNNDKIKQLLLLLKSESNGIGKTEFLQLVLETIDGVYTIYYLFSNTNMSSDTQDQFD